jgi:tetratricopeptide (TPR) repeat protein
VRPQQPVKTQPAPAPAAIPKAAVSAEEHDRRGRALTASGKYPEAIEELSEAIRLKPDFSRALNARGYVYLLKRDYPHAAADFDEAIRLDPNYINAYHNRSVARRALGDAAGAAADLQKGR